MAIVTVPTRVDDIDGSTEQVQAVAIVFDNTVYTVDLGPDHRSALHHALTPFLEVASEVGDLPDYLLPGQDEAAVAVTPEPTPAPRVEKAKPARRARKAATSKAARKQAATGPKVADPIPPSAKELREWANANGFTVSRTGAIPTAVRDAYEAAH